MIDDPYRVLGITRDASKEEIKKAYRKKAKEYHPDLHPDDPKAAEKMNELNEAYDMLQNPEKYQKRASQGSSGQGGYYGYGGSGQGDYYGNARGQGGQQSAGGYGGFGGFGDFDDFFGFGRYSQTPPNPTVESGDREEIRQVVEFINRQQYASAIGILNNVVSTFRDARWFYLSSLANFGQGNQILALEQIQKALQIEPNNAVYRTTLQSMQYSGNAYNQSGQEFQQYAESMNRMCMGMCLANLFCNCLC